METPSNSVHCDEKFCVDGVKNRVGKQEIQINALVKHPHEIAALKILENCHHNGTIIHLS